MYNYVAFFTFCIYIYLKPGKTFFSNLIPFDIYSIIILTHKYVYA
jgi:hypothetical protein